MAPDPDAACRPEAPHHSLPSYFEPTPETHRAMTREEEAEAALTATQFSPGSRAFLIALFLLTIVAVPVVQWIAERGSPTGDNSLSQVFHLLPFAAPGNQVHGVRDLWHMLPSSAAIKSAESTVENESILAHRLRPLVQSLLTLHLHAGTESVYPGRAGWLFYRPDVDYVTGPPFLDARWLAQRARATGFPSDPVAAIADFHRLLKARGIELIVMPTPVKPTVQPEWLAGAGATGMSQNASMAEFQARLKAQGVRIFDPLPLFRQEKAADPHRALYLAADTHWRPETMQEAAAALAVMLSVPARTTANTKVVEKQVTAAGDILRMLDLPSQQTIYGPETVTIRQVTAGNGLWRPSRDARVLLLGDSFCNIYSLDAMGWGESAGFGEHLSHALGEPVDTIIRNSDGAYATREILARELARGRDRLAGKKWVIWEFAARELAFGNWKAVTLNAPVKAGGKMLSLQAGESMTVSATVEEISSIPRPGTVPYRDHVATMHLVELDGAKLTAGANLEAVAYVASMKDNTWTAAAHLRPGDRVSVRLRAWADVAAQYESINRSELDRPELQLEEPVWAEIVHP